MSKVTLPGKGLNITSGSLAREGGALTQADNLVLDAPGIYRKRQGSTRQSNFLGGPVWKMYSDKLLGSNLLANHGSNLRASALSYGDGSAAWTSISGTYTNQPGTRMQTTVGNKNHYLTTDEGLRRIESDNTGWYAGLPIALGLDLTKPAAVLSQSGGTDFLPINDFVAYRNTFVKSDAAGFEFEGLPSGRVIVQNVTGTSGWVAATAAQVRCRTYLPAALGATAGLTSTGITTAYSIRTYRTVVATGDPGDECYLVDEHKITSTDISNGYYEFVDNTPDAFLTAQLPLYSNQISGAVNANGFTGLANTGFRYPLRARCVEAFAGSVFLGNVQGFSEFEFVILGVGATGLNVGDTITIAGVTYTGIAPGAPANNQFVVYTAAATATENVRRTTQNLVEAINRSTTNTGCYAQTRTTLGPGGIWYGTVVLYARLPVAGDFGITATIAAGNSVTSPNLNAANLLSQQQQQPGGLVFSFNGSFQGSAFWNPDGFPPNNIIFIPRQDANIIALRVLRQEMFVFTDVGVYRLTGSSSADFALEEFSPSFHLLSPDSLAVCDEQIFAWGREGIARITSSGVDYISEGIELLLWQLVTPSNLAWVQSSIFVTAYRTYHKVIFHYPNSTSAAGDGYNCRFAFVYDTREKGWTRWVWPTATAGGALPGRDCAVVRWSDDLLFCGQWNTVGTDSYQFKELRTYATTDYQDALSTGSTTPLLVTMKWTPHAPVPDKNTTWDQFHSFWEVSEVFTNWTSPTNAIFTFFGDQGGAGNQVQLQPATACRLSRGDVPEQEGMSTRIVVQMIHNVANEFVGLEGMALLFHTEGDATVNS